MAKKDYVWTDHLGDAYTLEEMIDEILILRETNTNLHNLLYHAKTKIGFVADASIRARETVYKRQQPAVPVEEVKVDSDAPMAPERHYLDPPLKKERKKRTPKYALKIKDNLEPSVPKEIKKIKTSKTSVPKMETIDIKSLTEDALATNTRKKLISK